MPTTHGHGSLKVLRLCPHCHWSLKIGALTAIGHSRLVPSLPLVTQEPLDSRPWVTQDAALVPCPRCRAHVLPEVLS